MAQQKNSIKINITAATKGTREIDNLINQLSGMGYEVSAASDDLDGLNKELQTLARKSEAVSALEATKNVVDALGDELEQARKRASGLGRELANSAKPTKALQNNFDRAAAKVRQLKERLDEERVALKSSSNQARAAGIDTKRLVAEKVRLAAVSATTTEKVRVMTRGLRRMKKEMDGGRKSAADFRNGMSSISSQLARLQKLAGGFYIGGQVKSMVGDLARVADSYRRMEGRLKNVSDSQEEFNQAQQETSQIAQDTRTGLEDIVSLYSRLRFVQKDQNVAQEKTLQLTRLMSQAMKVSGASQAESAATLTQLTQAFSSGVLRGEEFNSMMEQGPRLAKALADGLGVPVSALRSMAEAGEITSDKLAKALISQADAIEQEYKNLPQTTEDAMTKIGNAWTQYVGELDKSTGATRSAVELLNLLADNLDSVATSITNLAGAGLAVMVAKWTVGVRVFVAEMIAARAATGGLGAAATATAGNMRKLNSVMKAAGWVGLAIAVKELSENLWELYSTYSAVNEAQQSQVDIQQRLEEKAQRYIETYQAWAQTQIKAEQELSALSESRANEYQGQLEAAQHYWNAVAIQQKQAGQDYAEANRHAAEYAAALDHLKQSQQGIRQVNNEVSATYFGLIANARSSNDAAIALSAAMVGLAGDTEKQSQATEYAAQRIQELTEQEKRAAQAQDERTRKAREAAIVALSTARADALSKNSTLELAAAHVKLLQQKSKLELLRKKGILSQKEYEKQSKELIKTLNDLAKTQQQLQGGLQNQKDGTDGVSDSTGKAGESQKQFNTALTETMTVGEKMAKHLEFWQQEMDGLSESSRRAFDSMVETINKADGALVTSFNLSSQAAQDNSAEIANISAQIQHMRSAYDQATGDVNRWMIAVEAAGLVVKREYLQQEEAFAKLEQRLRGLTGLTDEQADSFMRTLNGYSLLDQARLDGVRSQVEQLRQATEALNASIESTLRNLQNELDRYNNNLVEIERRKYEEERDRILEQLRQAQAANDAEAIANAQKALAVLDQLYQKRLEMARERQAKAGGATGSSETVNGGSYGSSSSGPQTQDSLTGSFAGRGSSAPAYGGSPGRGSLTGSFAGQSAPAAAARYVVEIKDASGNSTDIGVTDEEQAYKFLDALERAGLTSL